MIFLTNKLLFKSFLLHKEKDNLDKLKAMINEVTLNYSLHEIFRNSCEKFKNYFEDYYLKLVHKNYQPYLFNFFGKWLYNKYIKNNDSEGIILESEKLRNEGLYFLTALIYNFQDIRVLCLQNNNFNDQGYSYIHFTKRSFSKLIHLNISNNKISKQGVEKYLLDILTAAKFLKIFEAENCFDSESFDELLSFDTKKKKSIIENLKLSGNEMDFNHYKKFYNFIDELKNLKELDLSSTSLDYNFYFILSDYFRKKKRKLESLSMNNIDFNNYEIKKLSEALSECQSLKFLSIRNNSYSVQSIKIICEKIVSNKNLIFLDFSKSNDKLNSLKEEDIKYLRNIFEKLRGKDSFIISWSGTQCGPLKKGGLIISL